MLVETCLYSLHGPHHRVTWFQGFLSVEEQMSNEKMNSKCGGGEDLTQTHEEVAGLGLRKWNLLL